MDAIDARASGRDIAVQYAPTSIVIALLEHLLLYDKTTSQCSTTIVLWQGEHAAAGRPALSSGRASFSPRSLQSGRSDFGRCWSVGPRSRCATGQRNAFRRPGLRPQSAQMTHRPAAHSRTTRLSPARGMAVRPSSLTREPSLWRRGLARLRRLADRHVQRAGMCLVVIQPHRHR
jgi:hypothetical protein